ncbi:MAG: methylated-DNA--[protein]-cysteine S-methyltransferase [Bacteroidetes bacterium]|nr:methylated-DNA--[protein]-cysteine S-methyltransferase [Bacteroidota bacterium]
MSSYFASMESPIGRIALVSNETHLKSVLFAEDQVEESKNLPGILTESVAQLNEYFAGTRTDFELKLDPDGTGFQKKVWDQLLKVEYGTTKSYRDIAVELGSALNTRAVGAANGKNPISIIVPCHRIIGTSGKLVGYAGGLDRKKWLLLHEAQHAKNERLFK